MSAIVSTASAQKDKYQDAANEVDNWLSEKKASFLKERNDSYAALAANAANTLQSGLNSFANSGKTGLSGLTINYFGN